MQKIKWFCAKSRVTTRIKNDDKDCFNSNVHFSLKNFKDNYMHHICIWISNPKECWNLRKLKIHDIYTTYRVVKSSRGKNASLFGRENERTQIAQTSGGIYRRGGKKERRGFVAASHKRRACCLGEDLFSERIWSLSFAFSVFPFRRNRRDVSHFLYFTSEKNPTRFTRCSRNAIPRTVNRITDQDHTLYDTVANKLPLCRWVIMSAKRPRYSKQVDVTGAALSPYLTFSVAPPPFHEV